jgi:carbon storage regulator
MLVLSRKLGESIVIGNIRISIVRIDQSRVRIAIEAPPEVKVLREELVETDTQR